MTVICKDALVIHLDLHTIICIRIYTQLYAIICVVFPQLAALRVSVRICLTLIYITDCNPDPCNGHGTCQNVLNGYVCTCNHGYTGDTCDAGG